MPAETNLTLRHPEVGTGPVSTDIFWRPEFYERELAAIFRQAARRTLGQSPITRSR